jgi:hypothetical protein
MTVNLLKCSNKLCKIYFKIKLLWITSSGFIIDISIKVWGRVVFKFEHISGVEGFSGSKCKYIGLRMRLGLPKIKKKNIHFYVINLNDNKSIKM